MLNTLDLFAGIGGFSLGLERAGGFRTAAFCEIDPDAQSKLRKNWPDVPIYEDVAAITKDQLDADGTHIDVIAGGFPCQDISHARTGSGLGLGDALGGQRSGLWFEFLRLIREIQPQFAVIENVSAIRSRGLDVVLGGLSALGYDAEWHCFTASAFGAPQRRDRLFALAYPSSAGFPGPLLQGGSLPFAARTEIAQLGDLAVPCGGPWAGGPGDLRMGDGLSHEPHRLKQLGNAIVPLIPELIGRAINRAIAS